MDTFVPNKVAAVVLKKYLFDHNRRRDQTEGSTSVAGISPRNAAMTSCAAATWLRRRPSVVKAAMCGVATTRGWRSSG